MFMLTLKVVGFCLLAPVTLVLLAVVGFKGWLSWQYHLPVEQVVRTRFQQHKSEYRQFVDLLNKDPFVRFAQENGSTDRPTVSPALAYQRLMKAIGAEAVFIGEDRSIDFASYGFGGTMLDDLFLGVRFVPKNYKMKPQADSQQTLALSLDPATLPEENGRVASGLYAEPIEPEWYIYRYEYQE